MQQDLYNFTCGISTENTIPALKNIWMSAFDDTEVYTNFIFEKLLKPENILVLTDKNNNPLSMLCLQKMQIAFGDKSYLGHYIFGVATSPKHQGKGYSSALMAFAHEHLSSLESVASVLVPATKSLFNFYSAREYNIFSDKYYISIKEEDIPKKQSTWNMTPLEIDDFVVLRETIMEDCAFVRWDKSYLQYILDECRLLGGNAFKFTFAEKNCYAICYTNEDKLYVKEISATVGDFNDIIVLINNYYYKKEYIIVLNKSLSLSQKALSSPLSMIKWYNVAVQKHLNEATPKDVYIAHVLD